MEHWIQGPRGDCTDKLALCSRIVLEKTILSLGSGPWPRQGNYTLALFGERDLQNLQKNTLPQIPVMEGDGLPLGAVVHLAG